MKILDRLDKVKSVGRDKWKACCPAHSDKSPSLAITVKDDKILLRCWSGCSTKEILDALDLTWNDLFFNDLSSEEKKRRKNFHLREKLNLECAIIHITEKDRQKGQPLTEQDLDREKLAYKRIRDAGYIPNPNVISARGLKEK